MTELLELSRQVDTRWLLLVFLAAVDLWAIGLVTTSAAPRREKALWTGVIVLCPIVGCMFWFVLGPKPWLAGRASERPAD